MAIEWWEKVLENVPESYKEWFDKEKDYLIKHVSKGSSVLEVGCGEGRSLNYIKDTAKKIIGVDIDEKAILDAKNNLGDYKNISFFVEDGRKLSFKDDSFDYVLCLTTPANFMDETDKFYQEMKRIVKPKGEIIISVFNEDALLERLKLYKKLNSPIIKIEGNEVFFDIKDIPSSRGFSKEELEQIFKRNGLKVIELIKKSIGYFCRLKK